MKKVYIAMHFETGLVYVGRSVGNTPLSSLFYQVNFYNKDIPRKNWVFKEWDGNYNFYNIGVYIAQIKTSFNCEIEILNRNKTNQFEFYQGYYSNNNA